jgi:hypothetical protein
VTLEQAHLFSQGWAFVVALCVGSFMNVCIARMPEDRSVAYPAVALPVLRRGHSVVRQRARALVGAAAREVPGV